MHFFTEQKKKSKLEFNPNEFTVAKSTNNYAAQDNKSRQPAAVGGNS